MEVDPPATNQRIEFHPLAIVHMADQYTRITSGGSPLPSNAPVVGLLFGMTGEEEQWQVLDADDIATDIIETTQQQVSLHQAVFPLHSVVGWYRVSSEDAEPIAEDLQTTQRLQQHFCSSAEQPFIFCFCQVPKNKGSDGDNGIDEDDSENLPITLYQVDSDANVLLAMEDWTLKTSDAEKIAVETVLREQPQQESGFLKHAAEMESAIMKMKDRLSVLIQFLEDTQEGKVPFQPRLMRQVQSVVCHLGTLLAAQPPSAGVQDWLPHIAVAAKTVKAVQGYTDKVKLLQDNRAARRF
eukprot:CAMPEP_0194224602 /NCGR_PEP_ID=MMETSP0156-20130528/37880_1 /TAXON_ID=33649 /ORGANISM="Thalassionema nitzschioides, Strain L26-B" /LENGTH=296 /DNA_ID=CAMNT_0038956245 /DNA_START=84 /DNA_END=974 /DNA_ORIENTATION=+